MRRRQLLQALAAVFIAPRPLEVALLPPTWNGMVFVSTGVHFFGEPLGFSQPVRWQNEWHLSQIHLAPKLDKS